MRLILVLTALVAIACGGSDTAQTGGESAADKSVSAAGSGGEPPEAAVDPQIASCLDLVTQAKFAAALPVCLAALKAHPGNAELQAAAPAARSQRPFCFIPGYRSR